MTATTDVEAGVGGDASHFYLSPATSADRMLANMAGALARGLPEITVCKPHGLVMSIAGGGPSLADTYTELTGWVCAINGSLRWVLDHDPRPDTSYACGIMDAGSHIADMIVADPRVRYYVASICDPAVFDKLEGCDVRLWHVTPNSTEAPEAMAALLDSHRADWMAVGGGCTMGLRWINLGYILGFRTFNLHGLDSSFRGGSTHAYADRADTKDRITFNGRETRPNFLAQVYDFHGVLNAMAKRDPSVIINVFGDGLLQDEWKKYRAMHPGAFSGDPGAVVYAAEERAQAILQRLPPGPIRGAEIGVFTGHLSALLLSARPDLHLTMVDSWEGNGAAYVDPANSPDWHAHLSQSRQDNYLRTAISMTDFADDRRLLLRGRSLDAVSEIADASLDFVFLDADHSAEGLTADLAAWARKVKPGGLLCGHDYGNPMFPAVEPTVLAYGKDRAISVETGADYTWFVRC